jgi:hypothetical protein
MQKPTPLDLPFLDQFTIDTLFKCASGSEEDLDKIKSRQVRDFAEMLLGMQSYNIKYRTRQVQKLFPLLDETIGPLDSSSERTALWVALALAVKELYGMRPDTLKIVLKKVTVQA